MLGDGVAAVLVNDIKRGIKIGEVLGAAFEVGGAVLLGKALGRAAAGSGMVSRIRAKVPLVSKRSGWWGRGFIGGNSRVR